MQSRESNARVFPSLSGIWDNSHHIINGFPAVSPVEMLKSLKKLLWTDPRVTSTAMQQTQRISAKYPYSSLVPIVLHWPA